MGADRLSLPAGEARTGFVIAAALTAVAQFGGATRFGTVAAWATLVLHCASAGLVYLLFVNLTKRKLGAPLIAAVLYGAHPILSYQFSDVPTEWHAAGGTSLALLSGILLARTPLQPRLLWPSLAAYSASLALEPAGAAIPFLVAAAIVAYHGLDPARLLTRRLAPRFAIFLFPLACSVAWSLTTEAHFPWPVGGHPLELVALTAVPFELPVYRSDLIGAGVLLAMASFGTVRLRSAPKSAWPILALGVSLAAGSLLVDAWGWLTGVAVPIAFFALLLAEGIEQMFYRFGARVAMPLLVLVYAAFATQSHVLAARWN